MERNQILALVKRVVEANDNEPVGERAFYNATNVTRRMLWKAGFSNYGAALEAAGYSANELKTSYSDDVLFTALAKLTRELGHVPTDAERFIARTKDKLFPGYAAYRRRSQKEPLSRALFDWCQRHEHFQDVAQIVRETLPQQKLNLEKANGRKVNGYVYLMRYGSGKDYKIGCTENVARRELQIDMISPTDVRLVHSIETDDPRGIEKYWHERFATRRLKTKEVFRLTPEDVAAFKARRYQ